MRCRLASDAIPRTTLDLDSSVLTELRLRAAREHKNLGALASELLAVQLARDEPEPDRLNWVSRDLGPPRIDLEDKEALAALLDTGP